MSVGVWEYVSKTALMAAGVVVVGRYILATALVFAGTAIMPRDVRDALMEVDGDVMAERFPS